MPERLTLFTGPSCRLCEDAKALIYPHLGADFCLTEMDVTSSLQTKKDYGLRIPVLRREHLSEELPWPFDSEMLARFLLADR